MSASPPPVDGRALAAELEEGVEGEVRFDGGARGAYATDASNFRQVPIGVVLPRSADDVQAAMEVCRRHGAPVLGRGGGTSVAGQCCNAAVVFDFSRHMGEILEIDPHRKQARVQPGVVLDRLRRAAAPHGLTFGPDPATHDRCTLGGMIGNDACGVHSLTAGRTVDNVEELELLTYHGLRMRVGPVSDQELERFIAGGGPEAEIHQRLRDLRDRHGDLIRERYPDIPRRVSGYNLDQLLPEKGFHVARSLVGTEGTCVMLLEATVRLVPDPPHRSLVVLGFPEVEAAAEAVPEVLGFDPVGLEGMDRLLTEGMRAKGLHRREAELLPIGGAWLLVEFGAEQRREVDERARRLAAAFEGRAGLSALVLTQRRAQEAVWRVRESAVGAATRVPGRGDTWPGWEDSAVDPEALGGYLGGLRGLLEAYRYRGALYGHFGEGCVHTRIDFDLESAEGVRRYRSFLEEAADLVVAHGGSLSGEHGDGQQRAELLPRMFGEELVLAFGQFKAIWDPDDRMNPGKVVRPRRLDQELRLGPGFRPARPQTRFRFPDDDGSLGRAALRCVGVGKCRREDGGTMCPSYMVTREEIHSTRGRARLLHEMLVGEVVGGGWRDPHLKEALDLCLACKGCRSDCPVNVDMATYKAEFLSHYYARRLRPRQAYTMGLVHWWARAGGRAPRLANLLTQTPGLRTVTKALAGVAGARRVPLLAEQTFTAWFARREPHNRGGPRVLLWPDTFTNCFEPEIAAAAVRVLEQAGFRVTIPEIRLCCGRPLYDYGMLGLAERQWRRILTSLAPAIAEGIPVVGVEPSCVAAFRDELVGLFPDREDAARLAGQTHLLEEFLVARGYRPGRLEGRALVHGHCQGKAVLGMDAEEEVLTGLGLDFEVLDSGCCGMAGSFGFEPDKYEVSMACGERVLLPAVRRAAPATLIVANGFSCREQIRQATGRRPVALAQLLAQAEGL